MTKAQQKRSISALARRRADVKKYKGTSALTQFGTPETLARKLKAAETDVANLEKKLGISSTPPVSNVK